MEYLAEQVGEDACKRIDIQGWKSMLIVRDRVTFRDIWRCVAGDNAEKELSKHYYYLETDEGPGLYWTVVLTGADECD